jgi:hypothetical protein
VVFAPPGGGPQFFKVLNFQSVTSPFAGDYCVRPTAGIMASGGPPLVSVDLDLTSGAGLMVFVYTRALHQGCTPDDYEVLTVKVVNGTPVPAGNIAFTILVP